MVEIDRDPVIAVDFRVISNRAIKRSCISEILDGPGSSRSIDGI